MRIVRSKLWKEPRIAGMIIRNSPVLDPTILLDNPTIYFIVKKDELVAFLAIKKHSRVYELKSVYTCLSYRNKGYMRILINLAVKEHPHIYLICKSNLVHFYKKFGFYETDIAPPILLFKRNLFNLFCFLFDTRAVILIKTQQIKIKNRNKK